MSLLDVVSSLAFTASSSPRDQIVSVAFEPLPSRMVGRHSRKGRGYSAPVSTPLVLRDLAAEPAPERFISSVLPWVLEAGDPYFGWLLGERELATRIERWMHRPSSE